MSPSLSQNAMCNDRAAQQCLEFHPDFADFTPGDACDGLVEVLHETKFKLLRAPPAAKFAVLIDATCDSYEHGRIARMKQAAMRLA